MFGQHRDLLLLAGHAGNAIPLPSLEEEGPFSGLTNCPCHEPIGRVVAVHQNRHALQGKSVRQCAPKAFRGACRRAMRAYRAMSAAPRPPPAGASSDDFGRRVRAFLGGGDKKLARSTVVELAVIRYGRAAV